MFTPAAISHRFCQRFTSGLFGAATVEGERWSGGHDRVDQSAEYDSAVLSLLHFSSSPRPLALKYVDDLLILVQQKSLMECLLSSVPTLAPDPTFTTELRNVTRQDF